MKSRLWYLAICSLVLAAIVHICIIFLIPLFGEKDAARRIVNSSPLNQFKMLDSDQKIDLNNGDPFFQVATCKFDLSERGLAVTGNQTNIFWSASIFNSRGRVLYSLNESTAIRNKLNLILVNPIQMAGIRQIQPEGLEDSIVVETSETGGFVIVRVLLPDSSWKPSVDDFLASLSCSPYSVLG